ncbi:hypothetical protein L5876_11525 [Hyphobacterium sp. SN044]|uniref:hypothetical protein n=1 Tax=Hyphobacterium sp. SN044 TaxID=2912575 RepID=UPI001F335F56|nr:hypothetical protein [Hyphobacterium sp. SN044]MCF8880446.1 hypothetical protein [Hyphobacterium sp. SN044]
MISAAFLIAVTPLPDVADLLDCAREERVSLVASSEPADGVAFRTVRFSDAYAFLAELLAAETGEYLLIVWPDGADLAGLARQVESTGMNRRVLIAAATEAEAATIRAETPDAGLLMTGITEHYEVLSSELDQRAMAAWFDYFPDAHTEYFLAGQGIETVIPDFPFAETMSAEDFALVRQQHIEILITDQPEDAIAAFGRAGDNCPAGGE